MAATNTTANNVKTVAVMMSMKDSILVSLLNSKSSSHVMKNSVWICEKSNARPLFHPDFSNLKYFVLVRAEFDEILIHFGIASSGLFTFLIDFFYFQDFSKIFWN